ncbi:hypothetical protein ACHAWC_001239 [Mediolabrus comicus]
MTLISPRLLLFIVVGSVVGKGCAFSCPPSRSHCRRSTTHLFVSSSAASEQKTDSGGGITSKLPSSSLSTATGPYIRIQKRGRHYDVQTAITTFQKKENSSITNNNNAVTTTTVDLHSQIHFGSSEYYNYFNDPKQFGSLYDKVLYELIVEDKFLKKSSSETTKQQQLGRTLMPTIDNLNPIAPTLADRNTASQYGLQCQVDGVQYCKENWIHADQQPLWALASTTATYPGSEAFTALLRPLTTVTNSASAQLTRRLFTHLFLPGDALSSWIRAILWFGVPAPELSILLVDWSSLSYIGRGKRRRQSRQASGGAANGGGNQTVEDGIAPISPIAAPVMLSLLTGNWGTARRLVFGQVLVGGQSSEDTSKNGVLIEKRNEHAMNVLRETLRQQQNEGEKKRIALLYGAGHCRDLHGRLEAEGFVPVRTEWRTAFRASSPKWGDYFNVDRDWSKKSVSKEDVTTSGFGPSTELAQFSEGVINSLSTSALESAAVGLVVLPLYLLIGGLDWVSTLQDFGLALDKGQYLDGILNMILYLVRHVALYVGISKFVVDWGGDNGIFEEDW